MPLLYAVVLAVICGGGITLLAMWVLRRGLDTSAKPPDPIDITKVALTIAAGIGGVVALVVAYRRQRDLEQGRFVERFGAAASQLGASQSAIRIAGVYAMAAIADEESGRWRQQCVDVLCGYLRLPYIPENGANYQTKQVTKLRAPDPPGIETEQHFEYLQNDREVRQTIIRVIGQHLRDVEDSWSACDFDFRTAYLEDLDLSGATFAGDSRFDGTRFAGTTDFSGAVFRRDARFSETTFAGAAEFAGATFSGGAEFGRATFSDSARFDHATFTKPARFGSARFARAARFASANFAGGALFVGARFFSRTVFDKASFAGDTKFGSVDFGTKPVSFANPARWGPADPEFDWDQDLSPKPTNVEPQDWPPTPTNNRP